MIFPPLKTPIPVDDTSTCFFIGQALARILDGWDSSGNFSAPPTANSI
jgi:hypothetical protein